MSAPDESLDTGQRQCTRVVAYPLPHLQTSIFNLVISILPLVYMLMVVWVSFRGGGGSRGDNGDRDTGDDRSRERAENGSEFPGPARFYGAVGTPLLPRGVPRGGRLHHPRGPRPRAWSVLARALYTDVAPVYRWVVFSLVLLSCAVTLLVITTPVDRDVSLGQFIPSWAHRFAFRSVEFAFALLLTCRPRGEDAARKGGFPSGNVQWPSRRIAVLAVLLALPSAVVRGTMWFVGGLVGEDDFDISLQFVSPGTPASEISRSASLWIAVDAYECAVFLALGPLMWYLWRPSAPDPELGGSGAKNAVKNAPLASSKGTTNPSSKARGAGDAARAPLLNPASGAGVARRNGPVNAMGAQGSMAYGAVAGTGGMPRNGGGGGGGGDAAAGTGHGFASGSKGGNAAGLAAGVPGAVVNQRARGCFSRFPRLWDVRPPLVGFALFEVAIRALRIGGSAMIMRSNDAIGAGDCCLVATDFLELAVLPWVVCMYVHRDSRILPSYLVRLARVLGARPPVDLPPSATRRPLRLDPSEILFAHPDDRNLVLSPPCRLDPCTVRLPGTWLGAPVTLVPFWVPEHEFEDSPLRRAVEDMAALGAHPSLISVLGYTHAHGVTLVVCQPLDDYVTLAEIVEGCEDQGAGITNPGSAGNNAGSGGRQGPSALPVGIQQQQQRYHQHQQQYVGSSPRNGGHVNNNNNNNNNSDGHNNGSHQGSVHAHHGSLPRYAPVGGGGGSLRRGVNPGQSPNGILHHQHPIHFNQTQHGGQGSSSDGDSPPSPGMPHDPMGHARPIGAQGDGTLNPTGPLSSPRHVALLFADIARAAVFLRRHGIVHGALRPGNILVRVGGGNGPATRPVGLLEGDGHTAGLLGFAAGLWGDGRVYGAHGPHDHRGGAPLPSQGRRPGTSSLGGGGYQFTNAWSRSSSPQLAMMYGDSVGGVGDSRLAAVGSLNSPPIQGASSPGILAPPSNAMMMGSDPSGAGYAGLAGAHQSGWWSDPFLAPEVASLASPPTSSSDAYALAQLVHYAIHGAPPAGFTGPNNNGNINGGGGGSGGLAGIHGLNGIGPGPGFANLEHVAQQITATRPDCEGALESLLGAVAAAGFDPTPAAAAGSGTAGCGEPGGAESLLADLATHLVYHASYPGPDGMDGVSELRVAAGLHPGLMGLRDRSGTAPVEAARQHGHLRAVEVIEMGLGWNGD